jgi:hypothetical protein
VAISHQPTDEWKTDMREELVNAVREVREGFSEGFAWFIGAALCGDIAYVVLNGTPMTVDTQATLISLIGLTYLLRGIRLARKAGRK